MARLPRDSRFETREARRRLPEQHEPYWRQIHPGLFIGYRKGPQGGTWWARKLDGKAYRKQRIGIADDISDAGNGVLTYSDAVRQAEVFADARRAHLKVGTTVADAIATYLTWYEGHRKRAAEARQKAEVHILPKLGTRRLDELTTAELRRWHLGLAEQPIRRRGKTRVKVDKTDAEAVRRRKSTANRILNVLRAALNHAHQEGAVDSAEAWRRLKPFREVDQPRVRYIGEADCQTLIKHCPPDFRHLVRGALLTGCRYGELIALRCDDFNADAKSIHVRYAKGGQGRHVPLSDEGLQFFAMLTEGRPATDLLFLRDEKSPKDDKPPEQKPWLKSHQARRMKAACEAAKITPPISFHDLRHTYASLLAMRGVPLAVIAHALGHSDTRMTERHYAHMQPSYVADTIRANLPDFGWRPDNVTSIKVARKRIAPKASS